MVYYSQGCSSNCLSCRLAGQATSLLLGKDLKKERGMKYRVTGRRLRRFCHTDTLLSDPQEELSAREKNPELLSNFFCDEGPSLNTSQH